MTGWQPRSSIGTRNEFTYRPEQEPPGWDSVIRNDRLLHEAIKLAKDGEIGNSDAIALLQMPHRPEDVKDVLDQVRAATDPRSEEAS